VAAPRGNVAIDFPGSELYVDSSVSSGVYALYIEGILGTGGVSWGGPSDEGEFCRDTEGDRRKLRGPAER